MASLLRRVARQRTTCDYARRLLHACSRAAVRQAAELNLLSRTRDR